MPIPLDIAGQKFGRLTAIRDVGKCIHGRVWLCWCDCGGESNVPASRLRGGHTRSCGCLTREAALKPKTSTHGFTRVANKATSYEYHIWSSMKQRCLNPKGKSYPRYGGRGITVDPSWLGPNGFLTFLKDMGPRPSRQHSVERKNRDGNYCKANCKWATQLEQQNNRSGTRAIEFKGETLTSAAWARRTGIPACTIRSRIDTGWTVERALSEPVHATGRRN